ncbi:hypothetical protein [Streptomyces noursei]|uniref:hypothetical protein n=1 Tax=Streptomyces noursei TaxID=1971 RepID=UPI001677B933|nr:hypothetical protein [Streptomyces noursei]MCZ1021271.1 hypothetical protein [Streptomyces noursei]GGX58905.1 hypothetical protein GCM10010341_92260 [Streptomyces noursei]
MQQETKSSTVLLVSLEVSVGLSSLPLLKGLVSPQEDLAVTGLQVAASSAELDQAQARKVNNLIATAESGHTLPRVPERGLPQGLAMMVPYKIAGTVQPPLAIQL